MSTKPTLDNISNAHQSLLLIIDVQQKLIPTMSENVIKAVIKNINAIQEMALILKIPSLISEQYPKGLGHTDSNILNKYQTGLAITEKTSFSCCLAPEFTKNLPKEKQQIVIVGMESHICVLQTALHLLSLDKKVFVVEDAICSRFKKHHQNAIARMSQEGVIISNSESVMFEWLVDSQHPHFKTASKLIR